MDDRLIDKIQVISCPLCRIFTHREVKTKLYWPKSIDEVPNAEFVVVLCKECKTPMVVVSEHLTDIHKELKGRILYQCRKMFGNSIILKKHNGQVKDHLHYHIYNITR